MVKRVLFVDDDNFLVDIAYQCLCGKYEVFTTQKSLEALEVFKLDPDNFDIVITDCCMPDMDGLTLAKKVKEINPTVPIILCTGFIGTVSPEEIDSIGFAEILLKPYLLKDLEEAIEKALNRVMVRI